MDLGAALVLALSIVRIWSAHWDSGTGLFNSIKHCLISSIFPIIENFVTKKGFVMFSSNLADIYFYFNL